MKMKKAKSGSSLGMKSVKAGYDKNPGVTRADIIVAAKKKAKGGTKMKKALFGSKSGLFDGGLLGMMKRKKAQKSAAPNPQMAPTSTMKKGGKMKTMKTGGTLSPSKTSTSTRLSTYGKMIGKNTAGKAKGGAKMTKKCKYGCK